MLDSPLPLPSCPTALPEEHFEQISNPSLLCLVREGMKQRYLGLHLVDVSPPNSLANDVAVPNQLGDDPMGAPLRHAHGLGDITHANAWVVRDAQ